MSLMSDVTCVHGCVTRDTEMREHRSPHNSIPLSPGDVAKHDFFNCELFGHARRRAVRARAFGMLTLQILRSRMRSLSLHTLPVSASTCLSTENDTRYM
jgi:hypothetical protein